MRGSSPTVSPRPEASDAPSPETCGSFPSCSDRFFPAILNEVCLIRLPTLLRGEDPADGRIAFQRKFGNHRFDLLDFIRVVGHVVQDDQDIPLRLYVGLVAGIRPKEQHAFQSLTMEIFKGILQGSVEKSRRRRSLPSLERLRAGRSPFFRAHVLSIRSARKIRASLFGMNHTIRSLPFERPQDWTDPSGRFRACFFEPTQSL